VKKYHPDKFAGTDLEEVAKEKLQEVNEAYSILMGNKSSQSRTYSNDSTSYQYSGGQDAFQQIRQMISIGDFYQAEILLMSIKERNAEWYYLNGLLLWQKGWYSEARSSLQRAVNMDPGNQEYRNTLFRLNNSFNSYQYRPGPRGNGVDFCDCCTTLYCADCLCECCGGDLIDCC
jgi:molecular chaperone DnaJ